jgi:predicted nucleic acid-binding protein
VIILDTNVLGALMRSVPDATVVRWLDRQPAESVWITSITLFETRFGLALLPSGRRRQRLELEFDRLLREDLENRVLDFDSAAATEAASLAAARQKSGRSVDMRDTQIAGWRVTPHWRLETSDILPILRFRSLILGSRRDDLPDQRPTTRFVRPIPSANLSTMFCARKPVSPAMAVRLGKLFGDGVSSAHGSFGTGGSCG